MSSLLEVPLPRRMHRLPVVRLVHGGAAERAWSWDLRDQFTREWWPQGITWAGERLLVSWYSRRGAGSRVSVVDLVARRYAHVALLTPEGEPLRVHAGGLAWDDGWLYVAATARGFWALHVDDLAPAVEEVAQQPSRNPGPTWRARTLHRPELPGSDQPFRWSFLDLVPFGWALRAQRPQGADVARMLLAGEYGRGGKSTRLALLGISDGQPQIDLELVGEGPNGMQGLITSCDGLVVSTSAGPWRRGSLHRLTLAGTPHLVDPTHTTRGGDAPVGVEDLTKSVDGLTWTTAEHPGRRAVIQLGKQDAGRPADAHH